MNRFVTVHLLMMAVFIGLGHPVAFAQTTQSAGAGVTPCTPEQVSEYLHLNGFYEDLAGKYKHGMEMDLKAVPHADKITPAAKERIVQTMVRDIDMLAKKLVPVFQKHLTQEQMRGLLDFYRANPQIVKAVRLAELDGMDVAARWGEQEIMKAFAEFAQEAAAKSEPVSPAPASAPASRPASRFQIRLVVPEGDTATPADEFSDPNGPGLKLRVARPVLLDETALASAALVRAGQTPAAAHEISIVFTPVGGEQFARVTTDHLHQRLAMILDGKLLFAPMIQSPITGGRGLISMSSRTPRVQAEALAEALNALIHQSQPATPPAPASAPAK